MKKLVATTSAVAAFLSMAPLAFAETTLNTCPSDSTFAVLCNLHFDNVIPFLVSLIFVIAVIVALFYLIYGGIRWITSGGDKGAVEAARQHIIAAVIGLVIVFLSYFVVSLIMQFFLGTNLGKLTIPSIPH